MDMKTLNKNIIVMIPDAIIDQQPLYALNAQNI